MIRVAKRTFKICKVERKCMLRACPGDGVDTVIMNISGIDGVGEDEGLLLGSVGL